MSSSLVRIKNTPPNELFPLLNTQVVCTVCSGAGNTLCAGDHVSWHNPLDNGESRIQHMLMTEDPVLGSLHTPLGKVTFVQIIGICQEELQAAQRWKGAGVIDILKRINGLALHMHFEVTFRAFCT